MKNAQNITITFLQMKRFLLNFWGEFALISMVAFSRLLLLLRSKIWIDTDCLLWFHLVVYSSLTIASIIIMVRRKALSLRYLSCTAIFAGQTIYGVTAYIQSPGVYITAFALLWIAAVLAVIRIVVWAIKIIRMHFINKKRE